MKRFDRSSSDREDEKSATEEPTDPPTSDPKLSRNSFHRRISNSSFDEVTVVTEDPISGGDVSVAEATLDPVSVGDFLLLRTSSSDGSQSTLCGDAAFKRVGVQGQSDQMSAALNTVDYVFRCCPMLNYRQRHELDHALADSRRKEMHNSDAATESRTIHLLRNRVLAEEKHNAEVMERVIGGTYNDGSPSAIKYGDVIQLQHVSTGGFVSALGSAAPCDPECRGVNLTQTGSR